MILISRLASFHASMMKIIGRPNQHLETLCLVLSNNNVSAPNKV